MTLTVQPAADFPLSTLCDVINRAFKGYVAGDIQFSLPALATFIVQADIHLSRSVVALQDGEPAGVAMLARRGWTVRIAAMGIAPDFQNQGVGRWLLAQIADQARANGDHAVVLEVIEQNPRAVHLYESVGYKTIRRLIGCDYKAAGQAVPSSASAALEQVDIREAARHLIAWERPDLPWQCSGFNLAKVGPPSVAYHSDGCYAICSNPTAETVAILGLAVPPERQRKGLATQLVVQLMATHPGKNWRVGPVCPEEYAPIFLRNGFTLNPINQFQMELRV